jgi:hypothetical protein
MCRHSVCKRSISFPIHSTRWVLLAFVVAASQSQIAGATKVVANSPVGYPVTSYVAPTPNSPEIDVIAINETRAPDRINHAHVAYSDASPMQPITLVLSSYSYAQWQFNIDPGAIVDKIVLNGYEQQVISGVGSIPVVDRSDFAHANPTLGAYPSTWPLDPGGGSPQGLLVRVEDLLGARATSFTGCYDCSSFTVLGTPANTPDVHPIVGAGNIVDGQNPDLIYNRQTGRVQIDVSDLAAQFTPDVFKTANLFFALVNRDGIFNASVLSPRFSPKLTAYSAQGQFNQNRVEYDTIGMSSWAGELLDLGNLFPPGISDAAALHNYLETARIRTYLGHESDFDLIVVGVPEPSSILLMSIACVAIAITRRRSSTSPAPK